MIENLLDSDVLMSMPSEEELQHIRDLVETQGGINAYYSLEEENDGNINTTINQHTNNANNINNDTSASGDVTVSGGDSDDIKEGGVVKMKLLFQRQTLLYSATAIHIQKGSNSNNNNATNSSSNKQKKKDKNLKLRGTLKGIHNNNVLTDHLKQ